MNLEELKSGMRVILRGGEFFYVGSYSNDELFLHNEANRIIKLSEDYRSDLTSHLGWEYDIKRVLPSPLELSSIEKITPVWEREVESLSIQEAERRLMTFGYNIKV